MRREPFWQNPDQGGWAVYTRGDGAGAGGGRMGISHRTNGGRSGSHAPLTKAEVGDREGP